jgi:uncharacterized membrane protein
MLAGDADRERAVGVLKDAFAEGRLTQGEYEDRVGLAYRARTYAELDALTADIPVPEPVVPLPTAPPARWAYAPPARRTNSYAIASLVCGVGGLAVGVTAVPAIVLGHMARRRIRETGEDGDGLAVAGLVLGYTVTALIAAVIALIVVAVAVTPGS